MSEYEKEQKLLQDQQYVLSKIRYYKDTSASTTSMDSSIRGNHIEAMIRGMGVGGGGAAPTENN
jgi:hypothetical protein